VPPPIGGSRQNPRRYRLSVAGEKAKGSPATDRAAAADRHRLTQSQDGPAHQRAGLPSTQRSADDSAIRDALVGGGEVSHAQAGDEPPASAERFSTRRAGGSRLHPAGPV